MVFNSISYFLFLPLVFLVHHFSPARLRWLVLLIASFAFYAALKATYLIPVLLLVTYRPGYNPPWLGKSYVTQIALRQGSAGMRASSSQTVELAV